MEGTARRARPSERCHSELGNGQNVLPAAALATGKYWKIASSRSSLEGLAHRVHAQQGHWLAVWQTYDA